MSTVAPSGWYPDPARVHQYRYFDGGTWTDHVSDNGVGGQAPLGPALLKVPRAKMWIFAVLSLFTFSINTPGFRLVLPFGVLFAIACWQVTKAPLREHEHAGSPAVGEMKAARWIAFGLALVCVAQAFFWLR